MFKNFLIFSVLAIAMSCGDDANVDVQEFTDQSLAEISLETRSGPTGCYELVFPISFIMADGSEIEVESFTEARTEFKEWKEANPDITGRPQLQFPVELVDEDGAFLSVDSKEDLLVIRKECRRNFVQHHGRRCFKLVYPIEIAFPDGTTLAVDGPKEAKLEVRKWRKENIGSDERPNLVFPIEVENIEDGTIIQVNSKEEIKALKEECR